MLVNDLRENGRLPEFIYGENEQYSFLHPHPQQFKHTKMDLRISLCAQV